MKELDHIYLKLLTIGLRTIRDAAYDGDLARCEAEAKHIHNIPSLVGEDNEKRHLYYITAEKSDYLEWVLSTKSEELMQFVSECYVPCWDILEDLLDISNQDTVEDDKGNKTGAELT